MGSAVEGSGAERRYDASGRRAALDDAHGPARDEARLDDAHGRLALPRPDGTAGPS